MWQLRAKVWCLGPLQVFSSTGYLVSISRCVAEAAWQKLPDCVCLCSRQVHLEHPQTKLSAVSYLAGLQSVVFCPNGRAYSLLRRYRIPGAYGSDAKVKKNTSPSGPWSINVCPSLRAWLAPCPANPDPDSTEGRAVRSGGEKGEQARDKPSPHGAPASSISPSASSGRLSLPWQAWSVQESAHAVL
ncbi:hypothetical protein GGI35DRAFT_243870 [Trichoderma velutinum]